MKSVFFCLCLVAYNRFGGHGMVNRCFLFESLGLRVFALDVGSLGGILKSTEHKSKERPLTTLLKGGIQPRAKQLCLRS